MSAPPEIQRRIDALKAKAAMKQAAADACPGHIWKADYVSAIPAIGNPGGSSVCVLCGERRGWDRATGHQALS
jgi:hypothetical protein